MWLGNDKEIQIRGDKMLKKVLFILFAGVFLAGCSAGDDSASKSSTDDHVFREQTRALERAQGVEKMILDSAGERGQQIEEQTR